MLNLKIFCGVAEAVDFVIKRHSGHVSQCSRDCVVRCKQISYVFLDVVGMKRKGYTYAMRCTKLLKV